ncbi:alkaline phosphatase D family protein [Novosphingobium sp. SG720]|uniref:alkaline phosphatase D family protein n=1 Tax=Novosphingobium sp. SG720 TaxID=2586998 RepID=UPI0014451E11|nr:alkaline phosphatase D family protein [Novosphingobium sp. SG720]NKJ41241.1 alkaline phosphatase D [Novosphingobium sp. SG720]
MQFHRRDIIKTAMLGAGALLAPDWARAAALIGARGFTHSVASGEPGAHEVLLWTRYVPTDGGVADLRVELSETEDFARAFAGGTMQTGPWRDHTVKIVATDLAAARRYFYRFIAPDGTRSPVGRTRTLPADGQQPWRAAVFSCSNLPFGWFNAYAHAAQNDAFDCTIHLGDYFYEYAPGHYPEGADAVAGRAILPDANTVHVADYRLRFASYRADPDLQELHRRFPMIAQWDDHESANDSWSGGAQHHDPATEGDWGVRKDAAMQVYREWMPVSEAPWKAYDIGGLATLFRTETRLLGRTQQPDVAPLFKAADPIAALKAFRDGAWQDPAATMMGSEQEAWLAGAMQASVKSGRPWQIVGFGTIMGQTVMPASAQDWLANEVAPVAAYLKSGMAQAKLGLPFNYDSWGGYPAARARFLRSAQALGGNTVVISGDSHNAWAYNLRQDGHAAAVEFAGHSVTSPGYEHDVRTAPDTVARGLVGANPELAWCDTARRGYMALTVTAQAVTNEWIMVDTIRQRSPAASVGHRATVRLGRNAMEA